MSERKNDFIELTNEHGYKVLINQSQIASIQRTDYKNYSGVIFFANGEGSYVKETYEEIKSMLLGEKAERENPRPLTLDELQEMVDTREWAWVEMNFGTVGWCKPFQKYPLSMKNVDGGYVTERDFERGFIEGAYRYPPKEGDKF